MTVCHPAHLLCAGLLLGALGCATCGPDAPSGATTGHPQPAAAGPPSCVQACPPTQRCASDGRCVPLAWFCGPRLYASGDGCDCDCGAVDPDCSRSDAPTYCYNGGLPLRVGSCAECASLPPRF